MSQATLPQVQQNALGATARKDLWWLGPFLTFLGLLAFVIYATVRAFMGDYFEIRNLWSGPGAHPTHPYLSPFYSPLLVDDVSPHAWYHTHPLISAALLILWGPVLFRFTCYYYRKAYYRAFWLDPPACGVGEPRKSYWGERFFPLIFQNVHRYTLYIAIVFLIFLWYDVFVAFWWHTTRDGTYHPDSGQFGFGVGTLVMLANILLLSGFTLGCNSLRHLVGGRLDCFSCPARNGNFDGTPRPRYRLWQWVTKFNNRHMEWAWLSLFSVGFTDFYIMMCSLGYWHDLRLL